MMTISTLRAVLVEDYHLCMVFFFIFFNLLSDIQSHFDCHYWVEIRLIILDRSLNGSELIIVDRSTSSLHLIPVCERTHMNSTVLFELAIMLIICWKISFDGLEDCREVKVYDKSFFNANGLNIDSYFSDGNYFCVKMLDSVGNLY
jgi:hypothetical protein